MPYQYVIKNVKIYDGTGGKPYVSDVLIKGEKIEKIGKELKALEEIDGTGLCLSSGFIDAHTHSDTQLFVDPDRAHKLKMGVTSEIGGQCGWSRAPFAPDMKPEARNYLETVNGKREFVPQYETFEDYADYMENKIKLGAHQKVFTGHCMIRASVVGMDNRPMTEAELDRACALLEECMKQGSLGLSSGLVYAPSCYGTTEELAALCKVAAKYGGIYTTHMRNEADFVEEAVAEAINIARLSGIKLNISHLKTLYPHNFYKTEKILDMIDSAIAEGMDITFDVYPYEASSATMMSTLPPSYLSEGVDRMVERVTGKENIEILRKNLYEPTEKFSNPMKNIGPEKMLITRAVTTPEAVGKTIAEYAEMLGIDGVEAYAKLLADNRGAVSDVRFNMSDEMIAKLYKHPKCMVGTDGLFTSEKKLSHPRHFGSYPRYLGRFVREMKILPMEEGIRRITSMPAERYGLKTKGYVREGYDADLVLFDENTIIDHADYLDPFAANEGIKAVFVMGGIAVHDNVYTNLRNGKFYKK